MATKAEYKNFASPDEVRTFNHGRMELVNIGGGTVGRFTLNPGWRWSEDVKPIAGTEWCTVPHFQYLISGRVHIKMADGNEFDLGPGDVLNLPANHDAWVLGNEPAVMVDWFSAASYAKH